MKTLKQMRVEAILENIISKIETIVNTYNDIKNGVMLGDIQPCKSRKILRPLLDRDRLLNRRIAKIIRKYGEMDEEMLSRYSSAVNKGNDFLSFLLF